MNTEIQNSLSQEFGLPFSAIQEIGQAYEQDTLNRNNYGSDSHRSHEKVKPSDFGAIQKKHDLDLCKAEQIGWAWKWEMMQEVK